MARKKFLAFLPGWRFNRSVNEAFEPIFHSPVGLALAAAFGAIWGSFLNVYIARVPRGMSVVHPASHCFACGKPVQVIDNIPIFSYFILRGRCRSCGAHFSPRYALVEALAAALAAALFWKFVTVVPPSALGVGLGRFLVAFAFTAVLLVLAFIDFDTKRLPDVITLPSIPSFFLGGFALQVASWQDRAIGLCAGYLLVRIIADAYYYTTGREGLGLGDGKLLAVVGALLGWRCLPVVVFLASFSGILVAVPALLLQRRSRPAGQEPAAATPPMELVEVPLRRTEVPFGPFLVASTLVFLFWGDVLLAAVSRMVLGE